jgi:hypothetical protein
MGKKNEGVNFPEDVTSLSKEELKDLEERGVAEFETLAKGDVDATVMETLRGLASGITSVRTQYESVVQAEAAQAAELASMRESVGVSVGGEGEGDGGGEGAGVDATPAAVTAGARPTGGATTSPREPGRRGLNVPLSDAAAAAQSRGQDIVMPGSRSESVLVASADVPGFGLGSRLTDMNALVAAMQSRARALPILSRGDDTTRYPIASLQREFKHTLSLDSSPADIDAVLKAATDVESLVAAGGWCSPSEISYDFYNIVCVDGTLDIPTVGINRGGMRHPVSPSFGDLVGNAAMWSWTETQDIAAVTGTAQSGTKTCARVPCPTFAEERLECDGLCLTVGNLTEDAYPELIANHTRLLFAAHAHKMNAKRIARLVSRSTAVSGAALGDPGTGVVNPVLGALELQAIDYREKFAMCQDAVLEVVLPRWLRGVMRSDLRKRTRENPNMISVTDALLMSFFDAMNVRVQWVGDWQTRTTGYFGTSTPLIQWPTQVQYMMWAPGTWVQGNGLRLDLGVIRDSVLNATNDHTAEWMEECWLLAQVGHESRLGTINICPDGTVGAADLTGCTV